jgi:spore germination protein KC
LRVIIILALAVILALTSGCWGQREMDEIGIVTVTGVDMEPDGMVRITVHSVQPFGSPVSPSDRSFTWVGTATGRNIMDAGKNLRRTATKKLAWVHSKVIIVGEEMARQEFAKLLDYLSRNREIRYNCNVLVTQGTAFDMMQVPADIEKNLAKELEGLIMNADEWSKSYVSDIKEFLVSSSSVYSSIITARVGHHTSGMDTFSTSREEYRKMNPGTKYLGIAFLEGTAVFKEEKLVGWLSGEETRGYRWIMGKVKPGVVVAGTFSDGYEMAMASSKTESRIKVCCNDGVPTARVKLNVEGRIVEHVTEKEPEKKEHMEKIESIFAEVIKGEMESAVRKAQQYNSDIFDFLEHACMANSPARKRFEQDWDNIFPNLQVEYDVEVTIQRTGMVLERIFG